jgi:type I restriction enzyme S subunit
MSTNQGFKSIVPAPGVFNEYVYYFLKSAKSLAENRASGTTFKELSGSVFSRLPLPLAPTTEQHRIVAKIEELISELDNGIESVKTAREQLQVYRQALLKSAFEGKITEQWRETHKSTLESPDHLIARIKKERNSDYKTRISAWSAVSDKNGGKPRPPKTFAPLDKREFQELPTLPDSWIWEKLGWMTCGVEYGTAAKSLESGSVPVLRMGNIQNTKFDWSDLVYTSDEEEIRKYSLREGDVLFNRTNSPELVGKTAIYRAGERPALFAGYLIRVNQIPTIVDNQYLNLFLNSRIARQHGNRVKTDGVNQSNINGEKLSNYPFPYCSLTEQCEIVKILEEKLSLVDQLEGAIALELEKAETLRQSILRKAFSGKLVAQDPNDESTSVLLERISKEKAEKVSGKKRIKSRAAA